MILSASTTAHSADGRLGPHWRGHVFLFDRRPTPCYEPTVGIRLLLVVLLMEGVVGPRLGLFQWLGLPVPTPWIRVPLLLSLVLILAVVFARAKLSQLGFYAISKWSKTETSYFVQVLVLANLIFGLIFSGRLKAIVASSSLWGPGLAVLCLSLLWGLHQEVVYRGILQTELVRRWGTLPGMLVANLLFTFGPLHFYHFLEGNPLGTAAIFGGTFAIGLFFAVLFQRSGNLWMVGIFHGLGDWYILGLGTLVA